MALLKKMNYEPGIGAEKNGLCGWKREPALVRMAWWAGRGGRELAEVAAKMKYTPHTGPPPRNGPCGALTEVQHRIYQSSVRNGCNKAENAFSPLFFRCPTQTHRHRQSWKGERKKSDLVTW